MVTQQALRFHHALQYPSCHRVLLPYFVTSYFLHYSFSIKSLSMHIMGYNFLSKTHALFDLCRMIRSAAASLSPFLIEIRMRLDRT